MKTIRKILVPVDFSENSKNLLQQAVNIANYFHAEVILLHVYNRPLGRNGGKGIFEKGIIHSIDNALLNWKEKRIENRFNSLLKDVSNIYNTHFTIIKEVGLLSESIKQTINRYGVDLLIMGAKHAINKRSLWRAKAAKLTNRLNIPIMVLPYHFQFDPQLKIAFAYDLKKIKNLEVLNIVKMFSSLFDAKIHLFTVAHGANLSSEESKNLEILKEYFDGYQPEFHLVRSGDIEEGILNYTKTYKISLLTILHRSRNIFKDAFHASIAKKMAAKAEVPVLSIDDHM